MTFPGIQMTLVLIGLIHYCYRNSKSGKTNTDADRDPGILISGLWWNSPQALRNCPGRMVIFFAYCLLPTAYCLLPTAYCLLPTAYCLLPTAYCLLL
jgi:hypothetical protein